MTGIQDKWGTLALLTRNAAPPRLMRVIHSTRRNFGASCGQTSAKGHLCAKLARRHGLLPDHRLAGLPSLLGGRAGGGGQGGRGGGQEVGGMGGRGGESLQPHVVTSVEAMELAPRAAVIIS